MKSSKPAKTTWEEEAPASAIDVDFYRSLSRWPPPSILLSYNFCCFFFRMTSWNTLRNYCMKFIEKAKSWEKVTKEALELNTKVRIDKLILVWSWWYRVEIEEQSEQIVEDIKGRGLERNLKNFLFSSTKTTFHHPSNPIFRFSFIFYAPGENSTSAPNTNFSPKTWFITIINYRMTNYI